MCASALKQYTQGELKTGFVNNIDDFCKKNRLRGGKSFVAGGFERDAGCGVAGPEHNLASMRSLLAVGGITKVRLQDAFQRIQQVEQRLLERSIKAAFLFLFWLQNWLHNLQFALNTAFASVKQVIIIQSGSVDKCGKLVADAEHNRAPMRSLLAVGGVAGGFERDAVGGVAGGFERDAVGSVAGGFERDAVGSVAGGFERDAVGGVAGGFECDAVGGVAVPRSAMGYVVAFQNRDTRGAGIHPPTTLSSYLWVCYQKFFRFWANRTLLFCYGLTSAKNVKKSPPYSTKALKNKKAPLKKSFKRGRKIH